MRAPRRSKLLAAQVAGAALLLLVPQVEALRDGGLGALAGYTAKTVPLLTQSSTSLAPVIAGFIPSSGGEGRLVTLAGANFAGVSSVSFGGVRADFSVLSESQIRAMVPPGAVTGPLSVITTSGTAVSGSNFLVTLTGDANGDCRVSILDFSLVIAHFGEQPHNSVIDADLNGDGVVNGVDFSILLGRFGRRC